ncbi:MAG: SPOR domain-containing protein [Campylobacterota bacterium]
MNEENDNKKSNLEDIMIDGGNGQKQLKKILMIVALVIVLLIVVISLTKVIIGTGDENQEQQVQQETIPAPAMSADEDPLFEEVPIEQEANDDLSKMISDLRDPKKREAQKTQTPEQNPQEKSVQQPVEQNKTVAQEPEPKEQEQPKPPQANEQETSKDSEHDPYSVANGWYIQVLSVSRVTPDKKFLNTILDSGYKYYLHRVDVSGKKITKVLVGPYETREEALAHRTRISDKINEGAFPFEVKDGS